MRPIELKPKFVEIFGIYGEFWQMKGVKASEKAIKTISRGDPDLVIYGCFNRARLSAFWHRVNFFKQCAAAGNTILANHPFYMDRDSSQARNALVTDFRAYRIKNQTLHNHYLIYNDFIGWQREVVNWYNQKVSQGFEVYKKQIYVWGGAGVGKTRFFKYLFGNYSIFSYTLILNSFFLYFLEKK